MALLEIVMRGEWMGKPSGGTCASVQKSRVKR